MDPADITGDAALEDLWWTQMSSQCAKHRSVSTLGETWVRTEEKGDDRDGGKALRTNIYKLETKIKTSSNSENELYVRKMRIL